MTDFREKLARPGPMLSGWMVTTPSPVVAQALAAAGADALIFDLEHGALDWPSVHAMIAATQGFDCTPGVRLTAIDPAQAKRALDLGAELVCFPLVRSVEDARTCVAALRYPPDGVRGWGPFIAHSRWDVPLPDYARRIGPRAACMLLIETRGALGEIEAICAEPGVDAVVVASFDLSVDLGVPGDFAHPDFAAAVARIEAAAKAGGVPLCGVAFEKAQADALRERGYRMISGFDVLAMKAAAGALAGWARGA